MTPADAAWVARQLAISAERDAARAEPCRCGHNRRDHFEEVGACRLVLRDCRCGSFRAAEVRP